MIVMKRTQKPDLAGRIPWIEQRTNTPPVFWRSSAYQTGDIRPAKGEPDVDSRVTALVEATTATDRGHEVHLLILHRIPLVSFRRGDVFLRGAHGGG